VSIVKKIAVNGLALLLVKARRLAIEQTLLCNGLMEIEGDVSHDLLSEVEDTIAGRYTAGFV